MKHTVIALIFAICAGLVFAQEGDVVFTDGTDAGGASSASDPYAFVVYSETKDHAKIDLAFNELTGVLRATYSLRDFTFNEGDAVAAVRDSVLAFARSRGYLKVRAYPGDDSVSYSPDGRTAYVRRFYILYEKSGMR